MRFLEIYQDIFTDRQTHCSSWALQNADLAIAGLQNTVDRSHELLLDIVRRKGMVEIKMFQAPVDLVDVIFGRHVAGASWQRASNTALPDQFTAS